MPTVTYINFDSTPLAASYSGFYAKILDDVFTPEECNELISETPEGWQPAGLSAADPGGQTVHSDFRNSERVLVIDDKLSDTIYERLRPLVEEDIGIIGKWSVITGKAGRKQGPTWKLARVKAS